MSIVLVGGHDRMHSEYMGICSKRGHHVKVYTQMPAKFGKVIGTPDGDSSIHLNGLPSNDSRSSKRSEKKEDSGVQMPYQQWNFIGRTVAGAGS